MKAVILAAGLGTRLRPLSNNFAKPSFWFFDKPILGHIIAKLYEAGITEIVLNLHYRPASIRRHLRGIVPKDVSITFSFEPVILGTAGALAPVKSFLSDSSFVIINGDIIIDIDLPSVIQSHQRSNTPATLVLHPPSQNEFPSVGADSRNRIASFPFGEFKDDNVHWQGTFTGIQIVEPEILDYIEPSGFQSITEDVYAVLLRKGIDINAYEFSGYWNDIGTPERYFQAHWNVMQPDREIIPGLVFQDSSYIGSETRIGKHCQVSNHVVLGNHVKVGEYSVLENVIVWPGLHINKHCHLKNGILYSQNQFYPVEIS